jgi:hypothetical protein
LTQERGGAPSRVVSFVSRRWFPLLLVLGAGLRIGLFLQNRSLWLDEATVALNILHKGPWELLGPLGFDQAAPPGFLLLVKAAERVFGASEFALRLVPLLWGLASLPLFFGLARRRLRPAAAPLACLLFAIAEPLVYYSAEVKQYSGDVALELVLWWFASRVEEEPLRLSGFAALGLAGATALFFSHTAVFVLGGIGLAFFAAARPARGQPGLAGPALTGCLWAAGFAGVYALSLHYLVGNAQLVRYFTERAPGFPPAGILAEGRWFVGRLLEVFQSPGGLDRDGIPALCAVVGAAVIFRRDRRALVTWAGPAALALLAAVLRVFPFEGRLVLFVVPALYLIVAEGAEEIVRGTRPGGLIVAGALGVLLLLHPVAAAVEGLGRPRYFEQIAPVLEHVSTSRRSGDVVYLYYGSQYAARYYLETRRLSLADVPASELLAPATAAAGSGWYAPALVSRPPGFFVGSSSRENWFQYGRQLDALAGHPRVWIIFSHVHIGNGVDERRFFLEHLDRMGTKLEAFEEPGASAYLYDLRARLSAAAAARRQLMAPLPLPPRRAGRPGEPRGGSG